ncbi:hypothetical protein NE237_001879 [Protea cynaroides]|uniref:CCT domain-containing protein n=1 Tax=Protea cynaroides TaxID=273540 RepID=A0A9Q0KTX9_9MAGN|nr:hypothetical protein NE237_001879 [Protea cynaroides]
MQPTLLKELNPRTQLPIFADTEDIRVYKDNLEDFRWLEKAAQKLIISGQLSRTSQLAKHAQWFPHPINFRPKPSLTFSDEVMMGEENFPFFGNGAINVTTKPETYTVSPLFGMSYQEQLLIPPVDFVEPGIDQFHMGPGAGYRQFISEKCDGFVSDFKPVYNSGVQDNSPSSTEEEPNVKVGRYSVEERKKRILKYLKKRNRRNFNKTIKYACRKTLADRRVRVRGRFARNNELNEACQEAPAIQSNNCIYEEGCSDHDGEQINLNGEEWMQEAVASLMYFPIFTDNLEELMSSVNCN